MTSMIRQTDSSLKEPTSQTRWASLKRCFVSTKSSCKPSAWRTSTQWTMWSVMLPTSVRMPTLERYFGRNFTIRCANKIAAPNSSDQSKRAHLSRISTCNPMRRCSILSSWMNFARLQGDQIPIQVSISPACRWISSTLRFKSKRWQWIVKVQLGCSTGSSLYPWRTWCIKRRLRLRSNWATWRLTRTRSAT